MPELTKLEQLEKDVLDTKAAFDDEKAAYDYSFNEAFDTAYAIYNDATYTAWSKAKRDLSNYLKEQDNNEN